jgi:hypothetical protein
MRRVKSPATLNSLLKYGWTVARKAVTVLHRKACTYLFSIARDLRNGAFSYQLLLKPPPGIVNLRRDPGKWPPFVALRKAAVPNMK